MRSPERWLLTDVLVADRLLDCRIRDGVVVELAAALRHAPGEQVLDGRRGALLPGLADHHLHLRATAAARRSIDLGGRPLSTLAPPPGNDLLRVIGAADAVTRRELDERFGDRPIRVQHRSGAVWTLNTAALCLLPDEIGEDERRTGRFWRSSGRLRALSPPVDRAALAAVGSQLAGYGITHVTDATPDGDPGALAVDQHVLSLAAAGTGPRKIVLGDHGDLDFAGLVAEIGAAHDRGRPVAVHSVTEASLSTLLAALGETGAVPGDRVEHAAVCSDAAAERLAALGLPVVTQPTIYARHGAAFRRDSDPRERDLLWRYAGLLRAGVGVAVSSDAPYGDLDPWRTVAAAATALAPDERVDPMTSFTSMLTHPADPVGAPRTVAVGCPADLCLLDDPLATALARAVDESHNPVLATFISGSVRYLRGPDRSSTPT